MPAVVTTKNGKGNAKDDAKKKKTPEECVVFESLKKRYHGFHKVGSGSYGVVCSAFDRESETKVAIKRVSPWADDEWDARHTLRELRLMYLLRGHPNVVSLHDAVLQPAGSDDLFIVMELMDSDLHRVISSKQALTGEHVSCMMAQLLLGVQALHAVGVLHRDLKPGNVLVSRDCQVRITDFGLSRCVADLTGASGPEQEQRDEAVKNPLTEYVVTRWYRCPEVLLAPHLPYAAAVDCWSVGCIFGELIARKPLFQGKNFVHQVQVILERLGTPDQRSLGFTPREDAARFLAKQPRHAFPGIAKLLPSATPKQQHMMTKFLQFNPKKRYTVQEALADPYFDDAPELPAASRAFYCDRPEERKRGNATPALLDFTKRVTSDPCFDFNFERKNATLDELKRSIVHDVKATNASVAARKNEPAPPPLPPAEAAAADPRPGAAGAPPPDRAARARRRAARGGPAGGAGRRRRAEPAHVPRRRRGEARARDQAAARARRRGAGATPARRRRGRWANRSHSGPLAALPDNGVPARHDDGTDRQRRASGRRGVGSASDAKLLTMRARLRRAELAGDAIAWRVRAVRGVRARGRGRAAPSAQAAARAPAHRNSTQLQLANVPRNGQGGLLSRLRSVSAR
ncbi:MAP kinase [Aureococcus anophagefferens]|uniref:MAP kinase n=1 Tax=Aureococcus anophagefferens TaxID=44056 RepID=A0ABR1G7T8_AURAN